MAYDHFKKPVRESEIITKGWAIKLDRMTVEQRRHAEKFISDILYEGESGNLSRYCSINIPNHSSSTLTPSYSYSISHFPPQIHIPELSPSSNNSSTNSLICDQTDSSHENPINNISKNCSPSTQSSSNVEGEQENAANYLQNFYSM